MPATVMKCSMLTRGGDVNGMEPNESSAMVGNEGKIASKIEREGQDFYS